MRRRALTLLAGTLAGTLTCGAATSQTVQSPVLNNQVQLGDVFSSQTLNVETVTDQTVGAANAKGNDYAASADGQDIDIRSNQTANGSVSARAVLNVGASSGSTTSLTSTAAGNAGQAAVSGGVLTGVLTQINGGPAVSAVSHIEAPHGAAGDVDVNTQASGNSHVLAVTNGTSGARFNQTNGAQVTSDGGGVYGLVTGSSRFQALTTGNDVTYDGEGWAGSRVVAGQQNNTNLTQAAQFTAFGQVQEGATVASAAGNQFDGVNQGFLLDANINQTNHSYVRAQSETSAASFGALEATAVGIGNSATVGDVGGEVVIDNTQLNDGGGIEVVANAVGGDGYDITGQATAMGNSVTGYACSECSGRMTVNNTQTNNTDVGASVTTTVTGQARSVMAITNAVGNSATYYVTHPTGQ